MTKNIIKIVFFILNFIGKTLVYNYTQLKSWHKNSYFKVCKCVCFDTHTLFLPEFIRFKALKRIKMIECMCVSVYVFVQSWFLKYLKKK